MIISIAWDHQSATWLLFATSWNYIIVTLYFVYAFFVSIKGYLTDEKGKNYRDAESQRSSWDELSVGLKIFWVFYNTAITICTVVVIMYWALLHDYDKKLSVDLDSYLTIDRHGVNLLLLLVDFFLHKIPFRILHFTFPFAVGVLYAIFNVSYWAGTENIIYSKFDWNQEPEQAAGFMVGLIVSIIFVHFILYWVHKLKELCIGCKWHVSNQINLQYR